MNSTAVVIREPELQRLLRLYIAEESTSLLRHDLRNRIGIIRNANFFLRKAMESSSDAALKQEKRHTEFFNLVDEQLAEMSRSLGTTLISSSPDGDRGGEKPIAEVVDTLLSRIVLPGSIEVRRQLPDGLVPWASEAEPQLALFCLLENAVEAMDGTGTVIIGARDLPGRKVAIDVEDTGSGLGDEAKTQAFEPFYSTKPGHVGLGLNVARRIVRRSGGNVELSSRPEGGSRATLTINPPRQTAGTAARNPNEQTSSARR